MGTDIHGWIEVQQYYQGVKPPYDRQWHGIVKIDGLITGSKPDIFSCLFGVTPYARFDPIAPHRNLPTDISEEASTDYLTCEGAFGETWVGWSEIAAINWLEDAVDCRPHRYQRDGTGDLVFIGKAAPHCSDIILEGNIWEVDSTVYKIERITRRETLTPDWELLFRLIEVLAQAYGKDNVRLVVWFDQ